MDINGSIALVTGANRGLGADTRTPTLGDEAGLRKGLEVNYLGPVAAATLDGIEAGDYEVLADETARRVRAALSGPLTDLYPALATTTRS